MAVNGMYKLMEQFAVHDGPGMRLIVFLKGCNLRCKWCQNPECIEPKPQLWYNKLRCKDEGKCVEVCSEGAISMDKDNKFDLEKCNDCFKCADACRPGAFEVIGKEISSDDLVKQILKYKFFFSRSKDGGVTISGGEPTFQSDFTADVLSQLKKEGINAAVECNLFGKYEKIWNVVQYCDYLICDIKHMNSDKHKAETGAPNELIHENLKKLNKDFNGKAIAVHIPLIPAWNDDEENIAKTLEFVKPLEKIARIDLLPFNLLPVSKYTAMGIKWEYAGIKGQSQEHLQKLVNIVNKYGGRFAHTVGGLW